MDPPPLSLLLEGHVWIEIRSEKERETSNCRFGSGRFHRCQGLVRIRAGLEGSDIPSGMAAVLAKVLSIECQITLCIDWVLSRPEEYGCEVVLNGRSEDDGSG